MTVAFIDCFSGVAGDMLLAALLDAGVELEALTAQLRALPVVGALWQLQVSAVLRGAGQIAAKHVRVLSALGDAAAPLPVPLGEELSHGVLDHDHQHSHEHSDGHSHNHDHGHGGDDDAGHAQHHSRGLAEITELLRGSTLSASVQSLAIDVFAALADAEAAVHGSAPQLVRFHEVGAIDSIVDTVGCLVALELLGVDRVFCSALPLSSGVVRTAHGLLPVPAPATLRLLQGFSLCPAPGDARGELVTPTGAALLRVLCQQRNAVGQQLPPQFRLRRIGVGAGTKDFASHPNVLRVLLGDIDTPPPPLGVDLQTLSLLQTNVDDMSPELLAHACDRLLRGGALDCWQESIAMKKGRLAVKLCVLCDGARVQDMLQLLFRLTSSLGVRMQTVTRAALRRELRQMETALGCVQVKLSFLGDELITAKAEYEDLAAVADRHQLTARETQRRVQAEIDAQLFPAVAERGGG